ncbi:MAG: carboxypeptidase-like regulatory domain-containing protein, partial [Gemmatimonadaceae bacterium]|nr:carboxypeptidase-like regulatory domain-containing protein [Gemmatimonadaceae bacterium]
MRRGIAAMLIGAWSSIPSLAHAQSVATTTLRGIVRDSLLVVGPLPGAVITLVSGVSVTTDASGRFAVPNVAPGRVRLDISHPAYDSLDITLPAFDLEVPASDGDTIVLALPGFATVARTVCGAPSPAGAGLIFGDVRSAADGGSTRGVIASIEWTEFAASTAGVVRRPQAVRDTTDADGRFVLCGVPLDLEPVVTFIGPTRVRREALAVGTGPLRRVRLRWPSAETTARVRLRVTDSAGPVANARIDLTPAGGSARTADDGW